MVVPGAPVNREHTLSFVFGNAVLVHIRNIMCVLQSIRLNLQYRLEYLPLTPGTLLPVQS